MSWSGHVEKLLGFCVLALVLSKCDAHVLEDDHHHDGHTCVHSELVEPELNKFMDKVMGMPLEAHRCANDNPEEGSMRKLLSDLQEPEPLRVKVDYQIDGLEPEKAKFLKEQLIPAMVGVLQRSLNVRKPVQGSLRLPHLCSSVFSQYPEYCLEVVKNCGAAQHNPEFMADWRTCQAPYDSQCTSHAGGPGASDADFVLYVTAKLEEACSPPYRAVASGGFCLFDIDNWYGSPNRPLAGVANLCPNRISTKPEDFGYMLDTAVHEVLHAILMSRRLMENYIDEDGNKRQETVKIQGGRASVVTPAVQKHVRDIFGCDNLDGAHLEDEGGSGTAGSHWESRLFMGEIMVGNSLASSRDTLSNITMALAEDSGWYVPNYENSGVLVEGYKKGCDYVEGDCTQNSPSLGDVFCWDDRPAGEQSNICTPDHKSIGYCRSGMQLMNGCSVITPFQNTDCTNPEHDRRAKNTGGLSVDMGTRHQTGARCFPMVTDRITRSNSFYRSYISASAACFATVCKDGQVYIRIPAAADQEARDIACPEGEIVDLALEGIGYLEGKVGPCPSSVSLCASHGCPGDCSGNGQCWYGTCTCHVGYVGEDCKQRACSTGSCPGGFKCNLLLGRCESNEGVFVAPKDPPTSATKPKPQPESPTILKPTKPTTPATEADPAKSPSPKPQGIPEAVVPPEEPMPQEPSAPYRPSVPSTPVQDEADEKDKNGTLLTGRAVWNGYLAGCAVFADIDGNLEWNQGEPGVLTTPFGEWSLRAPAGVEIVLDPASRSSCRDIFTGLKPKWPLRAPWGSTYISPLTNLAIWNNRMATVSMTLRAAIDDPDAGMSFNGDVMIARDSADVSSGDGEHRMPVGRPERVWVDNLLLSGLNLDLAQIVEKDVVQEVAENLDDDSERAVVLSVVLANTVTQIAAFTTGRTERLEDESTNVGKAIGDLLIQESFQADMLTTSKGALMVIELSQKGNVGFEENDQKAVAKAVAASNKAAYRASRSFNGVELLEKLSRMAQVVQGPFALSAAHLGGNEIDTAEYSQSTTNDALQQEMEGLDFVDIRRVLGLDEAPDSTQKYYAWLDFEHSGTGVFLAVFTILAFLFSMILCYCSRKRTSDGSLQPSGDGTVIVNPMMNAH